MYGNEQKRATVFQYFSLFTLIISCFGLLGIAAFIADRRRKEIGIRKVFGASLSRIIAMQIREIFVLTVIASVIALPIVHFYCQNWLGSYQYRITIDWWIYPLCGLIVSGIALLTISFQSIRAARSNPVDTLRFE